MPVSFKFCLSPGIDLSRCPVELTMGIAGQNEDTRLHDVTLYLPGGPALVKAAFKDNLPVAGLLGMNGFFEHFKICFDGPGEFCSLERIYKA